jgi:hypothetical protein
MPEEAVIEIRGFKGINIREPANMIQDDELIECINLDIGRAGELVKRTGFITQHNGDDLGLNSVRLLGQFHTVDYDQLLVQAGPDVFVSSDGTSWELIGTFDASHGVQYVDKFYIVSSTGLLREWDGDGAEILDADTATTVATVGAWENDLNATVTRDTVVLHTGQVATLKAVATAASQMRIRTSVAARDRFLVNAGESISIAGKSRAAGATKNVELRIEWFDAANASLGTNQTTIASNADVWTDHVINVVAPANARKFRLYWEVDAPNAGQAFNFAVMSVRDASGREILNSPSGTFCYVFRDRLFVINSEGTDGTENSKVTFSEINNFDYTGWPSVNNLLVSPGDGDFLTALAVIHDTLIVFKAETTWGLYIQGEPDNWVLRNMNPEIGCISKYTPREIEGFLFFVGPRGVYKTDGNIFEDISSNILPAFDNRVVNLTNANLDCAAWWEDRYIVLFNPTPATRRWFVYHLRSGGWTEWEFNGIQPAFFQEVNTITPAKGLWAGDLLASGKVLLYGGDIKTDGGVQYECRVQTKQFDFGFPGKMKRAKWFAAELEGPGSVAWTNNTEQGDKNNPISQSVIDRKAHKVKGAEFFRFWSLSMSLTSDQAFSLYGVSLFMHGKEKIIRTGT